MGGHGLIRDLRTEEVQPTSGPGGITRIFDKELSMSRISHVNAAKGITSFIVVPYIILNLYYVTAKRPSVSNTNGLKFVPKSM